VIYRKVILECLARERLQATDDMLRAEKQFKGCTPRELKEPFGFSRQTRTQYLKALRDRVTELSEAMTWVERQK